MIALPTLGQLRTVVAQLARRWLSIGGFLYLGCGIMAASVQADEVYQAPADFIQANLKQTPKPHVIWLDKAIQAQLSQVLGHSYPQARLRYWQVGERRVWILDEIGKEYPITAGFVIKQQQIERAKVLIYRETRGMEVHLPGYLEQFTGNHLVGEQLAKPIDGIAGATLSSNAMVNMARVALLLDQHIHD